MIKVSSIKFNNEMRTSQDLSFLLACIGEKVQIKTSFYYEDITYAVEKKKITLKPDSADVDLYDTTGIILCEDKYAFADTYVGDTIGVYTGGAHNHYTVTEKFSNSMIRTSYGGAKVELIGGTDYIYNSTPFNGVRFAYNLLADGKTFNSLIDNEFQQGVRNDVDCTSATPKTLTFTGLKSWQIGSMSIVGDGAVGGGATLGTSVQQKFTITHDTYITPLFLTSQYADLLLSIKPDYYAADKCPNYIARLSLGRNLNDPNGLQELDIPVDKSNVGWFNENFNGGPTNYVLTSLTIKKGVTTISALEFDTDITVEAVITNSTDTPFSTGNTKYVFGFMYLPENEDFYQNTGYNQAKNFVFDSKMNTIGAGSANGANYGTAMQVIKTVTSTYTSTSNVKVTATINIGADAKAIMQQGDYSRYAMFLITENHANTAVKSDKVNLLLQVSEFTVTNTTSDLIEVDGNAATFIMHPYTSKADAMSANDIEIFPVDDIVANLDFHIDFTNHTASEGIKIKKIQSKIGLKDTNNVEADITLEDFSFSTSNYPIVAGKAQAIDFEQARVFKTGSDIRKNVTCERDYASDTGDDLYYNYAYPFMNRWEYWVSNLITSPPAGIFDNTAPLNGLNHFWYRFTQVTDWVLYYKVIFTIEQNSEEFTQEFITEIINNNTYESNTDWGSEVIKTYDGATELVNGGTKYIYGYKDTTVKASFTKVSGGMPSINDVGMVIWIEVYESGGISDIRQISSFYDVDSASWFKSSDTSNRVKLTESGGVYTGECKIDYTKIPANSKFTIYARLYEFYNPDAKQFMDGDSFEFMDGELYEFMGGGSAALGTGTLVKQDVTLIKNSPTAGIRSSDVKDVMTALYSETIECCFEMPVLAESSYTSDFKNDKSSFVFFWSESFTGATMTLQKQVNGTWTDSATLNDATYGTLYSFGWHETIYNENAIGYLLEWANVLDIKGEGNYRIKCVGTAAFGSNQTQYSIDFCLKEYTDHRADRTVRIEYWQKGLIGSKEDDSLKLDFTGLNWYGQIRLPDARFGWDRSNYTAKYVKYQSGREVWTEDMQIEEYTLKTGRYNNDLHRVLKLEVFMADEIRVTDYNGENPNLHQNRYVIRNGNYEPKWVEGSKYASVELAFKQAYQNHEHKRC